MLTKTLVLGVGLVALSFGSVQAKEYTIEVTPDHRTCYRVTYVPATVLVNTRGRLFSGESDAWEGSVSDGSIVVHRRIPATYFETRRVIEEDHHSLSPTACP